MNLASNLERHAARDPGRVAIRFEGQSTTYGALNRDASRLADALGRRGIRAGERVALYLPNIPAFATVYYAVQKLGAVVVTINAIFRAEEVQFLLDDSGAAAVFTTAELIGFVPEGRRPPAPARGGRCGRRAARPLGSARTSCGRRRWRFRIGRPRRGRRRRAAVFLRHHRVSRKVSC